MLTLGTLQIGDDIVIVYHSTKVVRGVPVVYRVARESVRQGAAEYHVLHKDGPDGRDGHFVYLRENAVHNIDDTL